MKLSNKFIIITGTTSGIGKSLIDKLSVNNKVLAINRVGSSKVDNNNVEQFFFDITDKKAVSNFLSNIETQPDYIILNAGINKPDNFNKLDFDTFKEVFNVNFYGLLSFIHAGQKNNFINCTFLCMSSTSNIIPNPSAISYFLSKLNSYHLFKILNKTDKKNIYKTAIISPVATNIARHSKKLKGLQKLIYKLIVIDAEDATNSLIKFCINKNKVAYISLFGYFFYLFVALVLKFFPFIYKGSK